MSKMIAIRGKEISENTIVEALQKHCGFEENYQFKAGDVAVNPRLKEVRIICTDGRGGVMSINIDGMLESSTQKSFEYCNYKKIGILRDFIKRDC